MKESEFTQVLGQTLRLLVVRPRHAQQLYIVQARQHLDSQNTGSIKPQEKPCSLLISYKINYNTMRLLEELS